MVTVARPVADVVSVPVRTAARVAVTACDPCLGPVVVGCHLPALLRPTNAATVRNPASTRSPAR